MTDWGENEEANHRVVNANYTALDRSLTESLCAMFALVCLGLLALGAWIGGRP